MRYDCPFPFFHLCSCTCVSSNHPDRKFHNFWALKSIDWHFGSSLSLSLLRVETGEMSGQVMYVWERALFFKSRVETSFPLLSPYKELKSPPLPPDCSPDPSFILQLLLLYILTTIAASWLHSLLSNYFRFFFQILFLFGLRACVCFW